VDAGSAKRSSWVACPKCGHKVARVRTCDMEIKCRQCSYRFEAVIGPYPEMVQDSVEKDRAEPPTKKAQEGLNTAKDNQH
jgi:DNA-directed RNA polymerase subunit RPC12/RpoP